MKKEKKLSLNKATVARMEHSLDSAALNNVRGGTDFSTTLDTTQLQTNTPMFC